MEREIRNYDVYVRSDIGVRIVEDLKVIGNLLLSVIDGFNGIRNNDVGVRSDVGVWNVDDMKEIVNFNERL